jgi:hypothetical protein
VVKHPRIDKPVCRSCPARATTVTVCPAEQPSVRYNRSLPSLLLSYPLLELSSISFLPLQYLHTIPQL